MKLLLIVTTLLVSLSACASDMGKTAWQDPLQAKDRPAEDKMRDAGRKPNDVMNFLGVKPGMRVLELVASGGYYTEVLAGRVGAEGEVLSHNTKFMLEVRDGVNNKQMTDRLANNRLPNVTRFHREMGNLNLTNEVDAVTLILNYHDLLGLFESSVRENLLQELRTALKPGGVLGIVDSQANAGKHDAALHRVHNETVKTEVLQAGFTLHSEGFFLRNPDDNHELPVFNPAIRGKTDRFVYRFTK